MKNLLETGVHCGYSYYIVHNGMGFRCGYVSVPPGHPWHGKDYNSIDATIHGGLTYDGNDDVIIENWIVGFDCAHSGDAQDPSLKPDYQLPSFAGQIRTQEYVRAECLSLCEQAEAAVTFRDQLRMTVAQNKG
jgi:hypothetical protein